MKDKNIMNIKETKERILFLTDIINIANEEYYIKNMPTLSDNEFDIYFKELIFLENKYPKLKKNNSPTRKVGGYSSDEFSYYTHRYPLLSLNNAFSKEELYKFNSRCEKELNKRKLEYIAELKIDGVSISLVYKNGKLKVASTRGDGHVGENVTLNIKTIKDIPKTIKEFLDIEVRGEVYMDSNSFIRLNKERIKKNLFQFRNQRNAASGSLRQIDFEETKKRSLKTFFYEITYLNNNKIKTQEKSLKFLTENGFSVNKNRIIGRIDKIISFCEDFEEKKNKLEYNIDGIVIKLNNLNYQNELGSTSRSPKGSIAYKFPPKQKITKIKKIFFSVGRTGVLTPVAVLEPILISGSVISKVSLHNEDYIKNKDIRINDYVIIQKAGEIIPEVVKILKNKRKENYNLLEFPKYCPVCNSKVLRIDGEKKYKCTGNIYCSAQAVRSILHFASRDAMNIDGLGEKNIEILVKNNLIKNFTDIYTLKRIDLIKLDRFQEKSSNNLINSIKNSKKRGLGPLLYGFGISLIGIKVSKILSRHFRTIDKLLRANKEEFLRIEDIGEKASINLFSFFKKKENLNIIKKLKKLNILMEDTFVFENEILKSKKIALTGTFLNYDRKEILKIIEKFGGNVVSSVSKKTDFVIIGKNPGSKLEKAKQLNISILNENDFLRLIKR